MLVEERRRKNSSTRRKPLEAKDPESNQAPGTNKLLVQHAVVLLWVPEVIFCSS